MPFYRPDEAGLGGRAYNVTIEVLLAATQILNLLFFLPSLLMTGVWLIATLPAQVLRLVVSPLTFRNTVVPIIAFPGVVSVWLLFLPVKLLNLLAALIVYVFGPKTGRMVI
jgi:hypothetical protein